MTVGSPPDALDRRAFGRIGAFARSSARTCDAGSSRRHAENAAPERLTTAWHADAASGACSLLRCMARSSSPAPRSTRRPAEAAALRVSIRLRLQQLTALADPRDGELVGTAGDRKANIGGPIRSLGRRASARGGFAGSGGIRRLVPEALTRTLRQSEDDRRARLFPRRRGRCAPSDWTRGAELGVPYLRGVRHPTGEALPIDARAAADRGAARALAPLTSTRRRPTR